MTAPGALAKHQGVTERAGSRRALARPFRLKPAAVVAALVVALVISVTAGTAVGVVQLPFLETMWVIVVKTLRLPVELDPSQSAIIWNVRLPRVLIGGLVGFALVASGAAMQGLFRNPLAEPGIVGVSAGGSMGAVIAIFLGLQQAHPWAVPVGAFGGALLASWLAYVMATQRGRTDTMTLLLAGVALSSLFGAVISLLYHFVEDGVLRQIVYWLMGNLSGKRWEHLSAASPFVLVGVAGLLLLSPELNILSGGEDDARSLGVSVERLKRRVLDLCGPGRGRRDLHHGDDRLCGAHRPARPAAFDRTRSPLARPYQRAGRGDFLILCDLVARVSFSPIELRTGIVTAFVGVPFFLYLLFKQRETMAWE